GERQRLGVPAFVPAEESDAPQDVSLEPRIAQLAADPKRRAQRAIGGAGALEQRQQISFAEICLRQPSRWSGRREVLDQPADDLLLPAPQPHRFARALLLEQPIRTQLAAR